MCLYNNIIVFSPIQNTTPIKASRGKILKWDYPILTDTDKQEDIHNDHFEKRTNRLSEYKDKLKFVPNPVFQIGL